MLPEFSSKGKAIHTTPVFVLRFQGRVAIFEIKSTSGVRG